MAQRAKVLLPALGLIAARPLFAVDSVCGLIVALAAFTALVTVLCVGAAIHIATSVVRLSTGCLEHDGALVRHSVLDGDDIQGMLAPIEQPLANPILMLAVRSPRNGRVVRLSGGLWTPDDLESIARHVGVPIDPRPMSGAKFGGRAPGVLPLRYRRPWLFGSMAGLVVVALTAGGVVAWFMINNRPPFDDQPPRSVADSSVEHQDDVLAVIAGGVPGPWQAQEASWFTCKDDNDVKGWSRWVDIDRADGPPLTEHDLAPVADRLVALGYLPPTIDGSDGSSLWVTTTDTASFGDPSTRIEIYFDESGRIIASVHGPCDVPP